MVTLRDVFTLEEFMHHYEFIIIQEDLQAEAYEDVNKRKK